MNTFLVLLEEKDPKFLKDSLVSEHVEFLKKLKKDGHLVICGPFANVDRSMLVVRANSKSEAVELVKQDPFIKNSYYKKLSIHEFVEANEQNDWLANTQVKTPDPAERVDAAESFDEFSLIKNPPKTMSILFRKLKAGKTYEDFHEAWLPPVEDVTRYFNIPVLVINAQNVSDPTEMLSVGLIWSDFESAAKAYAGYQLSEELRQKNIEEVTSPSTEVRVAQIRDVDVLGN